VTPEEHRETFTGALYEWLEHSGVEFAEVTADAPPFTCRVDLNKLKISMIQLIEAFGGRFE
jgi:hypothetical protein